MGCWRIALLASLAGCSFNPGPFKGTGAIDAREIDADPTVDAAIDAPMVDAAPDADPCMAPFTRTTNGCHAFAPVTPRNWSDARTACMGLGGDLPKIDTLAESTYVATATGADANARVWIGLQGTSTDGTTWTWLDGQTVAAAGLNNWNTGEPGSGDVRGVIRPDGTWAGRAGTELYIVVCEK